MLVFFFFGHSSILVGNRFLRLKLISKREIDLSVIDKLLYVLGMIIVDVV